jgi:hypothetical protein
MEEEQLPTKQQSPKKSIPPYMKAVSGSLGGVVEACCLQPIDVIKTRLQLDRSGTYKGIIHCGSTISRSEGVRALWKGLTPFATHLTLKYTLRMWSNAMLQSVFKDSATGKLSNQARLLSGFGAGVLEALVIVTPFEVGTLRFWFQSKCTFLDYFFFNFLRKWQSLGWFGLMYLLDASQALFGSRDFAGKESKIVLECFKMAYHLSLIFVFRFFFFVGLKML